MRSAAGQLAGATHANVVAAPDGIAQQSVSVAHAAAPPQLKSYGGASTRWLSATRPSAGLPPPPSVVPDDDPPQAAIANSTQTSRMGRNVTEGKTRARCRLLAFTEKHALYIPTRKLRIAFVVDG